MKRTDTKKVAFLGVAVALGMVLSYLESLIPPLVAVPGLKPGLGNLVAAVLLYRYSWREAGAVNLCRILLTAMLFGSAVSLWYSLAGGALSLLAMVLIKRIGRFSPTGVSAVGGVCHNLGQVAVACLLLGKSAAAYLPALMVTGVITGAVIGGLTGLVLRRMGGWGAGGV